jgi:hypothetical protein
MGQAITSSVCTADFADDPSRWLGRSPVGHLEDAVVFYMVMHAFDPGLHALRRTSQIRESAGHFAELTRDTATATLH